MNIRWGGWCSLKPFCCILLSAPKPILDIHLDAPEISNYPLTQRRRLHKIHPTHSNYKTSLYYMPGPSPVPTPLRGSRGTGAEGAHRSFEVGITLVFFANFKGWNWRILLPCQITHSIGIRRGPWVSRWYVIDIMWLSYSEYVRACFHNNSYEWF